MSGTYCQHCGKPLLAGRELDAHTCPEGQQARAALAAAFPLAEPVGPRTYRAYYDAVGRAVEPQTDPVTRALLLLLEQEPGAEVKLELSHGNLVAVFYDHARSLSRTMSVSELRQFANGADRTLAANLRGMAIDLRGSRA